MHDDLVGRDFTADRLDDIWLTDISEHPTGQGKLYICAVKDVCSRRIVGYAKGPRMTARLADAALRIAIARRRPAHTVVVHSDRGGQFRSRRYQTTLRVHGLTGSMGRVGAAGDNAAMESFFSLLQHNVLDRSPWDTRDDLQLAIITWIERTYHRRRRQRALGKLTPIEFEAIIGPTGHRSMTCHNHRQLNSGQPPRREGSQHHGPRSKLAPRHRCSPLMNCWQSAVITQRSPQLSTRCSCQPRAGWPRWRDG